MSITTTQLKDIKQELAKLKPAKVTLDGNRSLTVREAIFALAPTLERMKKRGFDTHELVQRLQEKGIDIKSTTLARYLNEYRRGTDKKKAVKKDDAADTVTGTTTKSPPATKDMKDKTHPRPAPTDRAGHGNSGYGSSTYSRGGFEIIPDRPLDEL